MPIAASPTGSAALADRGRGAGRRPGSAGAGRGVHRRRPGSRRGSCRPTPARGAGTARAMLDQADREHDRHHQRRAARRSPSSTARSPAAAPAPSCSIGRTRSWPVSRPKIEISVHRQDNGAVDDLHPLGAGAARSRAAPAASTSRRPTVGAGTSFGAIRIFRDDEHRPGHRGSRWPAPPAPVLVSGGVRADADAELLADGDRRRQPADRLASAGRRVCRACSRRATACCRSSPTSWASSPDLAALRAQRRAQRRRAHPPPGSLVGTRTDTADFAGAAPQRHRLPRRDRPRHRQGGGHASRSTSAGAASAALAAQIAAGLGGYRLGRAERPRAPRDHARQRLRPGARARATAPITAADAAGHARAYGFAHYFGLNDLLVARRLRPDRGWPSARILPPTASAMSRSRLDVAAGPPLAGQPGRGRRQSRRPGTRGGVREPASPPSPAADLPAGQLSASPTMPAEIVAHGAVACGPGRPGRRRNDRALAEDLAVRRAGGLRRQSRRGAVARWCSSAGLQRLRPADLDHQRAVRRSAGDRPAEEPHDGGADRRSGPEPDGSRPACWPAQSAMREAQAAAASGKAATRFDQIAERRRELVRAKDARRVSRPRFVGQTERLTSGCQLMDGRWPASSTSPIGRGQRWCSGWTATSAARAARRARSTRCWPRSRTR